MDLNTKTRILQLLSEGFCQADISRRLKLAPSTVWYHTDIFKNSQLIKEVVCSNLHASTPLGERGNSPKLFYLTEEGKQYLFIQTHTHSTFSPGGEDSPLFELHAFNIKYPIIKDAAIKFSKEVTLKNWTKRIDNWKLCTVSGSDTAFVLHIHKIQANSPEALLLEARNIADKIITIYEGAHGMEFGRPTQLGNPHWVCLEDDDEQVRELKKGPAIRSEHFTIDKTPPTKGIEYNSLTEAMNRGNMAHNIAAIGPKLDNLEVMLSKLIDTLSTGFEKITGPQEYPKGPPNDDIGYG